MIFLHAPSNSTIFTLFLILLAGIALVAGVLHFFSKRFGLFAKFKVEGKLSVFFYGVGLFFVSIVIVIFLINLLLFALTT